MQFVKQNIKQNSLEKNNMDDEGRNSKFEGKTDRTTHVRDELAVFKYVSEM